jgi:hypothetical protein
MTQALTILQPTTTFLNTMHKLMVSFIWQGRHWKHPNFIYGRPDDGGIGVHHLPTRIDTLRFNFLQNFMATNEKQYAWYFQAHNIRTYAPALDGKDVLKLNLNPTRFPTMTPFYASALQAWHRMEPIVNPNLQFLEDLRCTSIRNSTLLTPHISGHTLRFDEAWSAINIHYVGELLMENGKWKEMEDINTSQCTQTTIRRLKTNIRTAEAFLRHDYPNLSPRCTTLAPLPPSFVIKQPNGLLIPLPIPRRKTYNTLFKSNVEEQAMVNGECHWQLGKPKWEAV